MWAGSEGKFCLSLHAERSPPLISVNSVISVVKLFAATITRFEEQNKSTATPQPQHLLSRYAENSRFVSGYRFSDIVGAP
jgi:hypothetical protein